MKTAVEFKFSCPVCHQHIAADSSMAGMQIDCPTCFRAIIVPKAPIGNTTKLILRGTHAKKQTSISSAVHQQNSGNHPSLKKLSVVVALITGLLVYAVSSYAKYNDQLHKQALKNSINKNIAQAGYNF